MKGGKKGKKAQDLSSKQTQTFIENLAGKWDRSERNVKDFSIILYYGST